MVNTEERGVGKTQHSLDAGEDESLHDGTMAAQTLAHVVSIDEEKKQRSLRSEPAKQLDLHLDSTPKVVMKYF